MTLPPRSEVLPHELQDLAEVLLREGEAFLGEDRADLVRLRRQQVGDLVRVAEAHHRDGHELLDQGPCLLPRDLREQARMLERIALLERELAPDRLLLLEELPDFREGDEVLFHPSRLLCLPQVLREHDGLLGLAAETDVHDVRAAAALDHLAVEPVEAVVGLPLLDARVDQDDGALPDLERLQGARDRREPALAGVPAELLPRPLHDALRGLHHGSSSVCTSSTSSARTASGTPSRPARLGRGRPPSPWTSSLMYVPASAVTSSVNPAPSQDVRRADRTWRTRTASALR